MFGSFDAHVLQLWRCPGAVFRAALQVWGLGCGVWGLGFGGWGVGFGVWGLGFGVLGAGFWVLGLAFEVREIEHKSRLFLAKGFKQRVISRWFLL